MHDVFCINPMSSKKKAKLPEANYAVTWTSSPHDFMWGCLSA